MEVLVISIIINGGMHAQAALSIISFMRSYVVMENTPLPIIILLIFAVSDFFDVHERLGVKCEDVTRFMDSMLMDIHSIISSLNHFKYARSALLSAHVILYMQPHQPKGTPSSLSTHRSCV